MITLGPSTGPLAPLLEVIPDFVYVYDLLERTPRYVNRRWAADFGYSAMDVSAGGPNFFASVLHPDDAEALAAHHCALARAAHDSAHVLCFRVRRKLGDYAWLESRDVPCERDARGTVTAFIGVAREITRDKELERRRAESDARFRAMIEHLPDAVFIAGADGRLLEVNAMACAQLGRGREELRGFAIQDFVAPEYHQRAQESLRGGPRPFRESVHVRKDGTRVPVEVALVPLQLEGAPVMLGVSRDLTERKLAEARTREEAELRAAIIDNAIEGVCVADVPAEGGGLRFGVWNGRMTEITGYDVEQMNRLGWFDTVYDNAADRVRALARLDGLRRGTEIVGEEWTLARKGGERRQVLISARMLPSLGSSTKLLCVLHDVTDRQRLHSELRDAQRLESIGRLAGTVAHDFNNLLQAILGGASMLTEDHSLTAAQASTVRDIATAAERGADLTRQLLTFSRRRHAQVQLLDLGAQVSETLRVVRRLLGQAVTVASSLTTECWVQGDPGMLDQVVMNLAVNARDAMPHGGTLSVRVGDAHSPAGKPAVLLEVTDTGAGISADALPHVFEPFFTTKPDGQGTGLGLATVYGIVMQHHGQISVDSAPGRGTTFRVWLPRATPSALRPGRSTPAPSQPRLRLLVVDDRDAVRRTTTRMLAQLGHTTQQASSTTEALDALASQKTPFDLVLTDIRLASGESGVELGRELTRRYPQLPVLYMSGYDEVLKDLPLVEGKDFLHKPFTLVQLAEALATRRSA